MTHLCFLGSVDTERELIGQIISDELGILLVKIDAKKEALKNALLSPKTSIIIPEGEIPPDQDMGELLKENALTIWFNDGKDNLYEEVADYILDTNEPNTQKKADLIMGYCKGRDFVHSSI